MIKTITIEEVEYIAIEMARQTMTWNEPIPGFETRYPGRLESCLSVPFQSFDKKLLYKGLTKKAAVLFYLMIKNHPFENGNKRIAVTTLLCFLMKNGKWLRIVDHEDLYKLAVTIAESDPLYKDQYVEIIYKFIGRHIT
jgi:death-on-curing family protein